MNDLLFDKYSKLPKEIQVQALDYIEFLMAKYQGNFSDKKQDEKNSEFQQLLLNGPVMNDAQYNQFLENRKYFNAWRTS